MASLPRTASYTLVAERTAADAAGRATGAPIARSLAAGTDTLGPPTSPVCSHLRHGFLRTELTIRPWPARSQAQPGMPPPAIQESQLQVEANELARRAPLAGHLQLRDEGQGLRTWNGRRSPGEALLAEVASGALNYAPRGRRTRHSTRTTPRLGAYCPPA